MMAWRGVIVSCLFAIVSSGCVSDTSGNSGEQFPAAPGGGEKPLYKPFDLSESQKSAAYDAVRGRLKDPLSALFEGTKGAKTDSSDDLILVCGYVNAKNSFGGYTGRKPYMAAIAKGNNALVLGMGGVESASLAVLKMCGRNGLIL